MTSSRRSCRTGVDQARAVGLLPIHRLVGPWRAVCASPRATAGSSKLTRRLLTRATRGRRVASHWVDPPGPADRGARSWGNPWGDSGEGNTTERTAVGNRTHLYLARGHACRSTSASARGVAGRGSQSRSHDDKAIKVGLWVYGDRHSGSTYTGSVAVKQAVGGALIATASRWEYVSSAELNALIRLGRLLHPTPMATSNPSRLRP